MSPITSATACEAGQQGNETASRSPFDIDPGLLELAAKLRTETMDPPDATPAKDLSAEGSVASSATGSQPLPPQLKLVLPLLPLLLRQVPDLGWCLHLPFSRLSAALIAWVLCVVGLVESVSIRSVQRWLKAEKIKPWNVRSWITPKNLKVFLERARVVLALYARVPTFGPTEVAYSVDEDTSIQARARASQEGPSKGKPGKLESSYVRAGVLQLFAALNIGTGKVFGALFPDKTFDEFSQFVIDLIRLAVKQGYKTIHLIMDNGSTHRPKVLQAGINTWLARYPELEGVTVKVHWLPVRSSWLNQVEIFFNHLQAFVLTVNNYPDTQALRERMLTFIKYWNLTKGPIEWTYTVADLEHQFNRKPDTPDPRLTRERKKRYRRVAPSAKQAA